MSLTFFIYFVRCWLNEKFLNAYVVHIIACHVTLVVVYKMADGVTIIIFKMLVI